MYTYCCRIHVNIRAYNSRTRIFIIVLRIIQWKSSIVHLGDLVKCPV